MLRLVETVTGRPVPEPKVSGPLRLSDIPPIRDVLAAARKLSAP
jgi:hypothetical protein